MITVELEHKDKDTFLKLPEIPDVVLPPVTIVTPTLNRYKEFPIAIHNWKNTNYPRKKLYWVIVDDSSEDNYIKLKELLEMEVKNDLDSGHIKLIHYNQSNNNNKKFNIGKKRNLCAANTKTDIICHMDDDDYYYPDHVKIRVTCLYFYKKPVCGTLQYNCYNLVDDTQFIACGKEELMNTGEGGLCYLKSFWNENKFNDEDSFEESVYFLKEHASDFVNIPCLWIMLAITHGKNTSKRKTYQQILEFSFLELLPVSDFEFLKQQKLNLMLSYPFNQECMNLANKIKISSNQEKLINKLTIKQRKNIIIRDLLNNIPTKTSTNIEDFLIICFPAQYIRELDFEKETELIEFIKENKQKYRFTIYTNCDKGYNFDGITLSPSWKWRSSNKYNNCLVMYDPSHLKLRINSNNIYFFNKYDYNLPEMQLAKIIQNFDDI